MARFFKEIGRADELGTGVRTLYKYVRIYSGALPTFVEGDHFRLTIPLNDDHSPDCTPASARQVLSEAPMRHTHRLEQRIITELVQGNSLSRKVLAQLTNHTPAQVRRWLEKLQAAGRLRRVGASHGGYWEIANDSQ